MTNAHILAGDLLANVQDRVLSGLLLPFREEGRTNLGRLTVPGPGVITIPGDVSHLNANEDHNQLKPRARFLLAQEGPGGVHAAFQVARTPEGDDLLARAAELRAKGTPMRLSAEVAGIVVKDGKATGGMLTGAAFVPAGAFASAGLFALEEPAPDTEDPAAEDPAPADEAPTVTVTVDAVPVTSVTVVEDDNPDNEEEQAPVGTATAPGDLIAQTTTPEPEVRAADLFAMLATATKTQDRDLLAALNDVKISGTGQVGTNIQTPQWLGELWSGREFQRRIVPLLGSANLTSLKVQGWRWTTKPAVGPWAGNKTAVPSNTPATEPYEVTAQPVAGAHDIGREFRDFDVPGFWESYFRAMTESYAKVSDAKVLADLLTTGAYTPVTRGTVPTGVSAGAVSIVDGALAVLDEGLPTFALVAKDLYREFLLTRSEDVLAYLNAALGLEEGTMTGFKIVPDSTLANGTVLVGNRSAATVHELDGSPIRVEGLDMVKGGIDPGLFGYVATVVHNPAALALVAPAGGGA